MNDLEKRIARLSNVPDSLVFVHASLDSTNTEARRLAESGCARPTLVIAERQSAGRGRMGRSFYSPADTGLYMTAMFEATESVSDTVLLTTSAAVATARAIERLARISVGIKWVNDLYRNGKKICGILCESFEENGKRFVLVGVGVNLCTEDFPDELKGIAGSLGVKKDIRHELAANIFGELWNYYHTRDQSGMIEYYREHSLVIGKRIVFFEDGKSCFGTARDVDEYGRLFVCLDNGDEKILSSGEITLRLDEGDGK